MLRIYREDSIFDKYSSFDTDTGRLSAIDEKQVREWFLDDKEDLDDFVAPLGQMSGDKQFFFGQTSPHHTRFPRRVYFQITRKCNLFCDYCFIKSSMEQTHIPTDRVFDMAEYLGRQGLMEVRLTGGEPTLHPDFQRIVTKFREEHVYVSVATNGIWPNETRDFLCRQPYIWVICSVDGKRDTHNRYRPGTFDKIVANLKYFKAQNPTGRIRLTTVLTRQNMRQMFGLGRICKEVGAESITVIPLRPQVRNQAVMSDMVNNREFKSVIEDLIRAKDAFGIPFTTTMETEFKNQMYCDPIVRKRLSCAAGREATNLDYNHARKIFMAYACSYSPASDPECVAALREPFLAGEFDADRVESFGEIWRREDVWQIYRDLSIRSRDCGDCSYLKNFQCTGSCPIQNIDYSSINVDGDVLAQLKRQLTSTGEWYCYSRILGNEHVKIGAEE